MGGSETGQVPSSVRRRLAPVIAAALVGGLLAWRGRVAAAVILVAVAVVVAAVPAIGQPVDRGLRRAAVRLSTWLGAVLFTAIDLVFVTPVWVLGRVLRRDPLRRHPTRRRGSSFSAVVAEADRSAEARSFSRERPRPTGGPVGRTVRAVPRVVGVMVLLLGANLALGYGWDTVSGHDEPAPRYGASVNPAQDRIRLVTTRADLANVATHYDPREDLPGLRDLPWWKPYMRELQIAPVIFYPYLLTKPLAYDGVVIHTDDNWERRSYEAKLAKGQRAPVVWFFGGSTAFGEGQRDDHTIPSEFARLAEADGTPVRVVNFGQRGWVLWQEMLLYELQLAKAKPADRPDIAVFYDGLNDMNVQVQNPLGQPSFYDLNTLAQKIGAPAPEVPGDNKVQVAQPNTDPDTHDALGALWHFYQRHSLAHKVAGKLSDWVAGVRAGATTPPVRASDTCYGGFGENNCVPDAVAVRTTVEVYQRGRAMVLDLSKRYGVDPVLYWQPLPGKQASYLEAGAKVGAPTVDLTSVLDDHQEAYIDGGHTDEAGARIVADAEYQRLKAQVRTLYQERNPGS